MRSEQQNLAAIRKHRFMPLFYHDDPQACLRVVRALYDGGARLIEFTNRGTEALRNFKALVKERELNMPDLTICAGTIKTTEDATGFIGAGADVLISPFFDHNIGDIAYMEKVLWVPGCMTPTEIHEAEKSGCALIKLFPGELLKPGFVEAVRPLFPHLDFLITGGVDPSPANLAAWFQAGACAVGMGSRLITKEILKNGQYGLLTDETAKLLHDVQSLMSTIRSDN